MKKQSLLPVLSIGLFAFMGFAFILNYLGVDAISSTFPPTNAFSKAITNGETIQASSYNSNLHLDFPYAQISDLTTQSCSANGNASNVLLNTNDENNDRILMIISEDGFIYRGIHCTHQIPHNLPHQPKGNTNTNNREGTRAYG